MQEKTAILIHGLHLDAKDWENISWGDPDNGIYGRISAGFREALRFDASLICMGSGASQRDGVMETEYGLRYALERISHMADFARFGVEDPKTWVMQRVFSDRLSLTTRDEVVICAKEARARGATRLVLVTSPTHVARAHQAALVLMDSDDNVAHFRGNLYAIAADVPYADSTADDVVVIEPPHYPGTTHVRLDRTLKDLRLFARRIDLLVEIDTSFKRIIEEFKPRL